MAHYGLGRGLDALIARKASLGASLAPSAPSFPLASNESAIDVPIERIDANPDQPRREFKEADLLELARSIEEYGVIQPLVVCRVGDRYRLIAGERRLRASKLAGRKAVPVVIRTLREHEDLAIALVENVQRVDLNPIELAKAYRRLLDDFGISAQELGVKLGVARVTITNLVRMLALPQEIQDAVADGSLGPSAARTILTVESPEEQLRFYHDLGKDKSFNNITRTARLYSKKEYRPRAVNTDADLMKREELLREHFGTRVTITRTQSGKGTVVIDFFSPEEMNSIINKIIQ